MAYTQDWLVNDNPCQKVVDSVRCLSIGVLKAVWKDQRASIKIYWAIIQRLIDHFLKIPLDHMLHHFVLTAWIWVVCDDQSISYQKLLGNLFEDTLKLSTPSTYDWVRGVKKCKSHCMNFPTALASPFSLSNRALLYAWNLYSSYTSSGTFFLKLED